MDKKINVNFECSELKNLGCLINILIFWLGIWPLLFFILGLIGIIFAIIGGYLSI